MTDNTSQTSQYSPPFHDPSLKDILLDIAQARWSVLLMCIFTIITSVAFTHFATPYYRSSVVIGPSESPMDAVSRQNLDSALGPVYSPAEFLRLSRQEDRQDRFTRLEVLITGQAVAQALIQDPKIINGVLRDRFMHRDNHENISAALMDEYLDRNLSIRLVGDTSLRRLVYDHPEPEFGQYFIQKAFLQANQHIQNQDTENIQRRIEHLIKSLNMASNPDQKNALAFLLTLEEQRLMLASSNTGYAAQIVDPFMTTEKPVWPRPFLFLACAILVGILFGYIIHLFTKAFNT